MYLESGSGAKNPIPNHLLEAVKKYIDIPLIAAGGIGSGATMFAAMSLGAEAVQIGSRFVLSNESSAHMNFKKAILKAKDGDTILTLKEITPVRLIPLSSIVTFCPT